MGWNEARAFLLPKERQPVITEVPGTQTMAGRPLQILDSELQTEYGEGLTPRKVVQHWLEKRGFFVREQDADSARLTWEDVEACLYSDGEALASLDLTFTLSRNSPNRWEIWQTLVNSLCNACDLSLVDSDATTKVGAGDLLRLLADSVSWKEFERNLGWPPIVLVRS